jgi:Calcineurin-like phosphoesterase
MQFDPQPMVNWYDARMLASTGLKTVLSSMFGNFADKREIQAALALHGTNGKNYYDLSIDPANQEKERKEIWIDYMSDTGDGFNSTFTMAKLLAAQQLDVGKTGVHGNNVLSEKRSLPRADLLILGGDEVYPTPEKIEYDNRFAGPFDTAFPEEPAENRPKMFAIPGNHDWYDGLTNFTKLFFQQRKIGNWQTCQDRSYFAIKLPYNYWIWGIDVQLNSDIDQPQKQYFKDIAICSMNEGDKVILCTAEPAWVYDTLQEKNESYKRLKYFESNFIRNYKNRIGKKFELVATLTGDLHHYSRYCVEEGAFEKKHLITAGGGGSFLHPTHNLPETLLKNDLNENKEYKLKDTFPSKKDSKKILYKNLLYPFKNWQFTMFMGAFHLFFAWMTMVTSVNPQNVKNDDTPTDFIEYLKTVDSPLQAFSVSMDTLLFNPFLILTILLLVIGVTKFTETNRRAFPEKLLLFWGFLHGILQFFVIPVIMWGFVKLNMGMFSMFENVAPFIKLICFSIEIFIFGGWIGASIMGGYLMLSNLIFKIHDNESFSALAHQDHKCFLRMHLTASQLLIYPIGIEKVCTDWQNISEDPQKPFYQGTLPKIKLIEKPIMVV